MRGYITVVNVIILLPHLFQGDYWCLRNLRGTFKQFNYERPEVLRRRLELAQRGPKDCPCQRVAHQRSGMKSTSPARDPATQTDKSQFVVAWCANRRLMITENGFLGLVPAVILTGRPARPRSLAWLDTVSLNGLVMHLPFPVTPWSCGADSRFSRLPGTLLLSQHGESAVPRASLLEAG